MKKMIALVTMILIVKIVIGQTYIPLIDNTNKIWKIYSGNDAMGDPYSFYLDSIIFNSDTLIGTNIYKKIIDFHTNYNMYYGWTYNQTSYHLREDSLKRVYQYEVNGDYLLYDFTLQLSDTFITYTDRSDTTNSIANYWQITSVDSLLVDGVYRKRFSFSCIKVLFPDGDSLWGLLGTDIWIEGIGSIYGLYDRTNPGTTGWDGEYLACYYENENLIYNTNIFNQINPITQSFFTSDCFTTITNTTTSKINHDKIYFDNGYLFIYTDYNEESKIYVYNTLGKCLLTKNFRGNAVVNLKNNEDGALLYKITKGNDLIKTGKIILINK